MYLDKTLRDYLDDLAAKKPAPGGGSAAALCGALGAGLLTMVGNYTVRNNKDRGAGEKAALILARAEKAREELERLIDADIEAYTELSRCLRAGRKDPEKLQILYRKAAAAPFEVCKLSAECLGLCRDIACCQNRNLMTDTASAAMMLEAAFFSAKFNVYVNLKYIKEMEHVETLHKVLASLEEKVPALKEEILEKCEDVGGRV